MQKSDPLLFKDTKILDFMQHRENTFLLRKNMCCVFIFRKIAGISKLQHLRLRMTDKLHNNAGITHNQKGNRWYYQR